MVTDRLSSGSDFPTANKSALSCTRLQVRLDPETVQENSISITEGHNVPEFESWWSTVYFNYGSHTWYRYESS